MPFDGKPQDYETKTDVFSLEGLIAWLETQRPETTYDPMNQRTCLLGTWAATEGFAADFGLRSGSFMYRRGRLFWRRKVNLANFKYVALLRPYTYGAALERARKLLGSR